MFVVDVRATAAQGIDGKARLQLLALSLSALEQQVAALPDQVHLVIDPRCALFRGLRNRLTHPTRPTLSRR